LQAVRAVDRGSHEPLVSRELFDAVHDVFEQANRPKYTKHRHAFAAGLLTCALCGCTITAERKKQRYVYYHCTGFKGRCRNTYVREEELSQQFEEVVGRIQIPGEVADVIAETLRTSQADKERFHRTAVMQLQQRYLSVQNKLDRAYDDRLGGNITDDLWTRRRRNGSGNSRRSGARRAVMRRQAPTTR
jgi:site-specific DNA recombinase